MRADFVKEISKAVVDKSFKAQQVMKEAKAGKGSHNSISKSVFYRHSSNKYLLNVKMLFFLQFLLLMRRWMTLRIWKKNIQLSSKAIGERGGDVIAKMQSVLETRFGTTLLSTTDDDRESDRLATIGVSTTFLIKLSIFNQILNHFVPPIIILFVFFRLCGYSSWPLLQEEKL